MSARLDAFERGWWDGYLREPLERGRELYRQTAARSRYAAGHAHGSRAGAKTEWRAATYVEALALNGGWKA